MDEPLPAAENRSTRSRAVQVLPMTALDAISVGGLCRRDSQTREEAYVHVRFGRNFYKRPKAGTRAGNCHMTLCRTKPCIGSLSSVRIRDTPWNKGRSATQ